jgi:hypothetical protein
MEFRIIVHPSDLDSNNYFDKQKVLYLPQSATVD